MKTEVQNLREKIRERRKLNDKADEVGAALHTEIAMRGESRQKTLPSPFLTH